MAIDNAYVFSIAIIYCKMISTKSAYCYEGPVAHNYPIN